MSNWIAEDTPAYLVFKDERPPLSDEGAAMSARQIIAETADRASASRAMAEHLHTIANIRHVQFAGESDMHRAAAAMFEASGTTVSDTSLTLRVWGRVYRIRAAG